MCAPIATRRARWPPDGLQASSMYPWLRISLHSDVIALRSARMTPPSSSRDRVQISTAHGRASRDCRVRAFDAYFSVRMWRRSARRVLRRCQGIVTRCRENHGRPGFEPQAS